MTPPSVVRMLPALRQGLSQGSDDERSAARVLLQRALHQAVDPRNSTPSPGLAFRIFKEARETAPDAARAAAELALASADLHETKRELLRRWLGLPDPEPQPPQDPTHPPGAGTVPTDAELGTVPISGETGTVPAESPAEGGEADEPVLDPLSDDQVAQAAERLPPPGPATPPEELAAPLDRDMLPGIPIELSEDALQLRLPGGRESRLGWGEIQALAVVEVAGLSTEPVTLIDCVLNWRRREQEPLRVVRMRLDAFEPKMLVEDSGEDPLETFLAELLERSHAIPLPDPESALGLRRSGFESLEAYEREVLGCA